MLPDRVSNPGPLTYEPGALPIALRGPALCPLGCVMSLSIQCTVASVESFSTYASSYLSCKAYNAYPQWAYSAEMTSYRRR